MTHGDGAAGCHGRLLGSCAFKQKEGAGRTGTRRIRTHFTKVTHLPKQPAEVDSMLTQVSHSVKRFLETIFGNYFLLADVMHTAATHNSTDMKGASR